MSLNVNTGSIITQQEAKDLARSFESRFPNEITSSFIGSANLEALLNQNDCIGIRIYNGYDEIAEKISLIMVGVDSKEKDIINNRLIYDQMATCPPMCPVDGLLINKIFLYLST